jgi:polysaccharide pyruvyl transferase CsaB
MTLRALIAGYYGAGNAGDEWILEALIGSLRRRDPQSEVRVLSYDPPATRRRHGVEAVGWGDLETLAGAVRWSSLVVAGGGGLWQDYWGFDPLDMLSGRPGGIAGYGTPIILAHLLGRPSVLLGAGVGPLREPASRAAVRDLAAMAGLVSVRDAASRDELIACGVPEGRIHLGADLAVLSEPDRSPAQGDPAISAPRPVLAVALRPWTFAGDPARWEAGIAAALGRWCEARGGHVVFVPLHDSSQPLEDDRLVAERVAAQVGLPDRVRQVPAGLSPSARFAILGAADVVLGMRYHALLAALASGVPCVGLAYDPKVRHLMDEVGCGDAVLGLEDLDAGKLAAVLIQAVDRPADHGRIDALRVRAQAGLDRAFELTNVPVQESPPPLLGEFVLGQSAHLAAFESALRRRFDLPASYASRAEAGLAAVDTAAGRLSSAVREQEQVREELDQARRDAIGVRSEFNEALAGKDAAENHLRDTNRDLVAQRLNLQGERARAADASAQHAALRATAGVRLLDLYWRVMRRLAPEGSPARKLLLQVRGTFRGGLTSTRWAISRKGGVGRLTSSGRWPVGRRDHAPGDEGWLRALDRFLDETLSQPARGTVVFIAPTRFEASEGQRSYHLALEFARRGWQVVFGYWRWHIGEERPRPAQDPGIFELPLDVLLVDPERALRPVTSGEGILFLEFPVPASFRFLATANARGYLTVYDAVDDWRAFQAAGQAPWYEPDFERSLGAVCDVILAVSRTLADQVGERCSRTVHLAPNAWSPDLLHGAVPMTIDRGTITLGYFGHLTEAWFDWDLLIECARRRPEWRIQLIGYGGGWRTTHLPPNVSYIGKLPRAALAAYAVSWDVGIIPFRTGDVAAAADPIKTYEYLALELPVVGAGIRAPFGAEALVRVAGDVDGFLRAVESAAASRAEQASDRRAFAVANTWERRVDSITRLLESDEPRAAFKRRLFEAAA